MQFLKANTQVKVLIGPFVDVGDGFTPETGITLGAADEAELVKHDATGGVDISAATWAALSTTAVDGYYNLTLTTSHTDTEGMLAVVVQDDDVCLPVVCRFMVLAEAAYDSMFTAKDTGFMDVNIKTIGRADAQETEANNLESACSNYSTTRGLTGTALPAAAAGAAGGVPLSTAGNAYDTMYAGIVTNAQGADVATDVAAAIGTDSKCLISTDAQDLSATLDVNTKTITAGAINAAAIAADAIDADALAADAIAEINATMDTALSDYDSPTKAEMDSAFTEIKGATWASGTDTLEHIRNKQTDIETDTQDIQSRLPAALVSGRMSSDAVAISGSTAAADNVEANIGNLDASIAGLNNLSAADVNTQVDAALDTAISGPTAGSLLDYVFRLERALVNKLTITEANGNTQLHNDSDVAEGSAIAAAFDSSSGTTTRKRIVS